MRNTLYGSIFALFLVLFIDGLAQGIIFPILTNTLISPHAHELVTNVSIQGRNILYGICIGIFFLTWFIGAPILSNLSDAIGRKKALVICLIGSAIGFILTALAFVVHSIMLIILGRIIDGFTTGSQPIAQAAIVDLCDPNKKARYLALIILAASLGLIAGPIIGGVFSDPNIIHWFSSTTPLYFAALITIVNIILLWRFFEETVQIRRLVKLGLSSSIRVFTSAFTLPTVRRLSIVFFLMQLAWGGYWIYGSAYLATRYGLTGLQNAVFMFMIGVGLSIGLISTGYLENKINPKILIFISFITLAIGLVFTILIPTPYVAWLVAVIGGVVIAMSYAFILKMYSEQVSSDKQGWVMGITNGIAALTAGVMAITTGLLAGISISLPLILAVCLLLLGGFLLMRLKIRG